MLLVVMLALWLAGRAARRQAQVFQLLWVLVAMSASLGTSNTAKTRSVENRLNALVPVVFPNTGGTITGNVDVTGNHTVGGTVSAGNQLLVNASGSATAEIGGNAHITSTLQVDSAISSGSSISAGSQLLVNASGSAAMEIGGNGHITGGMQVDGVMQLSTGSGMPQSAPSSCGSPSGLGFTTSQLLWCNSATSTINSLRSAMISAGVIS